MPKLTVEEAKSKFPIGSKVRVGTLPPTDQPIGGPDIAPDMRMFAGSDIEFKVLAITCLSSGFPAVQLETCPYGSQANRFFAPDWLITEIPSLESTKPVATKAKQANGLTTGQAALGPLAIAALFFGKQFMKNRQSAKAKSEDAKVVQQAEHQVEAKK